MGTDPALDAEVARAAGLREDLHRIPELGGREEATAALIRSSLADLGATAAAGTGVVTRLGPRAGPQVVLRSELDGLPVRELTGVAWASTNGSMHACGHDVHAAALVAALRLLHRREPLPLGVVGIFQPSEETYPSGARLMLREGVFAGMDIAGVAAMHVHPDVPYGAVAMTPGPVNAGVDELVITVRGRGGHAAYPHTAADPVVALAMTVVALQQVVSRSIDPMHPTVLSLSTLRAGEATNVIPDEAVATGTLRCLHNADRDGARARIEACVRSTAQAAGCAGEVEFVTGEPPLVNDPDLVAAVGGCLPAGLRVHDAELRSCGADDFAEFGVLGPTLMGFVGLAGHPAFAPEPLHSPRFLPPSDAVGVAARGLLAAYDGVVSLRQR